MYIGRNNPAISLDNRNKAPFIIKLVHLMEQIKVTGMADPFWTKCSVGHSTLPYTVNGIVSPICLTGC